MDETIARRLKAMGDPNRFRIIAFLSHCCCGCAAVREDGAVEGPTAGEVCCHITGAEKITSTISHHLHELAEAGLIDLSRRGKTMVCRLEPEALRAVAAELEKLASGDDQPVCCSTAEENCCS